ncbi:hypothetical protein BGX27_005659, partial [Mortierella sp. AM989]
MPSQYRRPITIIPDPMVHQNEQIGLTQVPEVAQHVPPVHTIGYISPYLTNHVRQATLRRVQWLVQYYETLQRDNRRLSTRDQSPSSPSYPYGLTWSHPRSHSVGPIPSSPRLRRRASSHGSGVRDLDRVAFTPVNLDHLRSQSQSQWVDQWIQSSESWTQLEIYPEIYHIERPFPSNSRFASIIPHFSVFLIDFPANPPQNQPRL